MTTRLALLLLGDGRLPTGAHAHSGGVEAAVAAGRITDEFDLETFVRGRLVTTGLVDAALSAASLHHVGTASSRGDVRKLLGRLDAEASPRIVVPALRKASRRLGRQLARAAARCWPASELVELADEYPCGAHQSVVLGCVGVAIGASPPDMANVSDRNSVGNDATPSSRAGISRSHAPSNRRSRTRPPSGVAGLFGRGEQAACRVVTDGCRR